MSQIKFDLYLIQVHGHTLIESDVQYCHVCYQVLISFSLINYHLFSVLIKFFRINFISSYFPNFADTS
jgi:hypothetical protein